MNRVPWENGEPELFLHAEDGVLGGFGDAEPQKQSTAVGTLVLLEAMLGGWRKYTRNIRSNPMGGRPRSPFGSCGSMTASSFARGMRSPMRVRNFSRRVVFFLVANSAWEKLG